MATTALTKSAQPMPPAQADALTAGVNMHALIDAAIKQGSAMDVIKELRQMEADMQARKAKLAFDDALSAFQAECPIIKKSRFGARNAYKYAPLDDVIAQVRDLIRAHGFNFTVSSEITEGWVKAVCKITHSGGHSEISEFKVPIDARNTMMNDPQRYAGSMTFAKRYAFCNGFGIMTADQDNDGATNPKPHGPAHATEKTRQWFIGQIQDIKAQAFQYAIDKGLLMPDEPLDKWPLDHVPVTKPELETLRKEIINHK